MTADSADDLSAALARTDAAYEPIQSLADWAPSDASHDGWDKAARLLIERRSSADPAEAATALRESLRAAAVDTGAIEGLYDTDHGFTMSVAHGAISLDQAEVEKGAGFRRNYEAQLEGFELALDVATSRRPITEVIIRHLHEVTCAGQSSYRVLTQVGVQDRELVLGTYKVEPNHPQRADGTYHAYAPVDLVAAEMGRLVDELRSSGFEGAHPSIQAAYAHHALTRIHPFPDGNGRVARLLASIWLMRSASIPLWVEAGDRMRYLAALEAADRGDSAAFVGFVAQVSVALMRELSAALLVAPAVATNERRSAIRFAREELLGMVAARLTAGLGEQVRPWARIAGHPPLATGLEWSPLGSSLSIEPRTGTRIWVSAGIDWDAEPAERIRLVTFRASPGNGSRTPGLDEPFDEADLVPKPTDRVDRRVASLVGYLIAEATYT